MSETYSAIHYRKRKDRGLCGQCACRPGIKVVTDGVERTLSYCIVCRDKQRQRQKNARENRTCTTCLDKPAKIGHKKCEDCLLKDRQAQNTRRAEAGELCKQCRKNPKAVWSKWFCEDCIDKHNKANQIQVKKLKENKICKSCRKRPVVGGGVVKKQAGWGNSNLYCKDCLEKIRSRRRAKTSKKTTERPWAKFRKKTATNGQPINIGARGGASEEYEQSFGVFDKGKII